MRSAAPPTPSAAELFNCDRGNTFPGDMHSLLQRTSPSSLAARYETTSQLPPTAQQQQQQQQQQHWSTASAEAGNSGSNSCCFYYSIDPRHASAPGDDSSPGPTASSSASRRTPTTVLMPAAVFAGSGSSITATIGLSPSPPPIITAAAAAAAASNAATTVAFSHSSHLGNGNGGGKSDYVKSGVWRANEAGDTAIHSTETASQDSYFPFSPPVIPTSPYNLANETRRTVGREGGNCCGSANCSMQGATEELGATQAPSAATFSACGVQPTSISFTEDLFFSPITTSIFATPTGSCCSGNVTAAAVATSSGQSPGPATVATVGGVSTMSMGVVPAASTWGDLSMGGPGSGVASPLYLVATAPSGGSLTLPSPTARQASATVSETSGVGSQANITVSIASSATRGEGSTALPSRARQQHLQSQQNRPFNTMALPASTSIFMHERSTGVGDGDESKSSNRDPPRAEQGFGERGGERSSGASNAGHAPNEDDPACDLPFRVSEGPEGANGGPAKVTAASVEKELELANTTHPSSSSSRRLATSTPPSLTSPGRIVFLPMDVSATGKVTPPSQQPTPYPQPAQGMPHVHWDPLHTWPPLPSAMTSSFSHANTNSGNPTSAAVAAATGTGASAMTPTSKPCSNESSQLLRSPCHPAAASSTTFSSFFPKSAASSATTGAPQRCLPRVVVPTQTRVPCAPVGPGVHAECSICLRTTDDVEDVVAENEHERLLQTKSRSRSASGGGLRPEPDAAEARQHQRAGATTVLSAVGPTPGPVPSLSQPPAVAHSGGVKSGSPMVRLLSCGHSFHSNCLQRWLLQEGSCPMCRRGVSDTPTAGAAGLAAVDAAALSASSGAALLPPHVAQ